MTQPLTRIGLVALLTLLATPAAAATWTIGPCDGESCFGSLSEAMASESVLSGDVLEVMFLAYSVSAPEVDSGNAVIIDRDITIKPSGSETGVPVPALIVLPGVELTLQDVSMFNDSRALPDAYATSYEGACGYAIDGDPLPVLCALGDVVAENVSIEDPLDVGIMVDGGSLTSGDADGGREGGLVLAGASHARALVVTHNGSASLNGATFYSNSAGAIYNSGGQVTVTASVFSSNGSSAIDGGVAQAIGPDAEVTLVGFGGLQPDLKNQTGGKGGAFFVSYGASLKLSGFQVTSTHAKTGGLAYVSGAYFEWIDGSIDGGVADNSGGAIHADASSLFIQSVQATACSAGLDGGFLHSTNTADSTLFDVTVEGSTATRAGGALAIDVAPTLAVEVDHSHFHDNFAHGGPGGAISASGTGAFYLFDSELQNNVADSADAGSGGGLAVSQLTQVTVQRALFCGNSTMGRGGGIDLASDVTSMLTVMNTVFLANEATEGGAVSVDGPLDGGSPALVAQLGNNAFIGTVSGGSAVSARGGNLAFFNNIVQNNALGLSAPSDTGEGSNNLWAGNSVDSDDGWAGRAGDVFAAPVYRVVNDNDSNGVTDNCVPEELWPWGDSPVIDAGAYADWMPSTEDDNGTPLDIGPFGGWPYPAGMDSDGDGFRDDDDCASGSADPATVHIGAPELCNGVDDDCDRIVDNDAIDAPVWWADADRDGFGDALGASIRDCGDPGDGWTDNAEDCDDTDPERGLDCDGRDTDGPALVWLSGARCGCASGGGPGAALVLTLAPLLWGRVRRGRAVTPANGVRSRP